MTHSRFCAAALSLSYLLAGCGGGASDPDKAGDPTGEEGSGASSGDDGAGSGSGSDGQNYGGNNSGGVDMSDDDATTQPTYPTGHPRIYLGANKARLQASLAANTPAATAFRSTVDRWVGGADIWGFEVWNAALLGPLTGDPKYCTKAVGAIDSAVAAEEALINANQRANVAADSYLHVGEKIGDLALVYDWCNSSLTTSQKTRWLKYANQAVWNVWHPTDAKWGNATYAWSGWSTNNPSDNYYYSFLRATMLLGLAAKGEDAQADGWVTYFRDTKLIGQLVPTFDAQLRGGGSREGTAYGVSQRGLFFLYDVWHATTGESLQARTKHARQSIRTAMHQVVPTLDRIVPTGDQPRDHTAMFYDYQRNYLQELIDMYPNDPYAARAKSLLAASSLPKMARPEMMVFDFLYDNDGVTARPLTEAATDYYGSGIGQIYSRSGWDKQATWINLTGGPYTESHAHQDQGALELYKEGWLASDGVIATKSGIYQETTSHSLVRITSGGTTVKQSVGTTSTVAALHSGNGWLHAAVDVTAAYKGNPAVGKVQREIVFLKPNVVVVYDRVATAAGTQQIWQIASPTKPSVSGATSTIAGTHTLKVQRLAPANATSASVDLAGTEDFTGGYRLDSSVAGGDVRYLHVLSLDGAATAATAVGDTGVNLTLSNGQTASVTFNRDNVGATLVYNGATTTLGATVDDLAE